MTCDGVASNAWGLLFVSPGALSAPLVGSGVEFWLDPSALVVVPVQSDALGSTRFPADLQPSTTPPGTTACVQLLWPDTCAPGGHAATRGLRVTVQP